MQINFFLPYFSSSSSYYVLFSYDHFFEKMFFRPHLSDGLRLKSQLSRKQLAELPQLPHGDVQHGTDGVIIVCGVFHVGIYSKKSFIFYHICEITHFFQAPLSPSCQSWLDGLRSKSCLAGECFFEFPYLLQSYAQDGADGLVIISGVLHIDIRF